MNVIDFINDSMVTIKMTYGVERLPRHLEEKQKTKKQKINKNKKKTKNKK
jgi:glycyl-tRNA synthetase alpha subunit